MNLMTLNFEENTCRTLV